MGAASSTRRKVNSATPSSTSTSFSFPPPPAGDEITKIDLSDMIEGSRDIGRFKLGMASYVPWGEENRWEKATTGTCISFATTSSSILLPLHLLSLLLLRFFSFSLFFSSFVSSRFRIIGLDLCC